MSAGIGASSSKPPFAMTGLSSRGGLSNWVFFFSPTDVVMIDLGIGPALKAGARAGVASQFGLAGAALGGSGRGPQNGGPGGLDEWREKLQAKAKKVRVLRDDGIRGIRLHMGALAHQLFVVTADGASEKYKLMNRAEAKAVKDGLSRRFGPRFEISTTGTYAFFDRYAPFLMS